MDKLIEALTIFLKYKNVEYPTHCADGVLWIMAVTQEEVTDEDKKRLEVLGFFWGEDAWQSFRYGSA